VKSRARAGLKQLLRDRFGVERLRPGQREVIESVIAGHDTLAVMPGGAGKSLCYQVPALWLRGTTIVVSPLIALMKDQADKLAERGVEAAAMSSALPPGEQATLADAIAREQSEVVYTTPERLGNAEFIALLRRNAIDLVVVDERTASPSGATISARRT
jgi:ATP-dependent DNA helicase RecQ